VCLAQRYTVEVKANVPGLVHGPLRGHVAINGQLEEVPHVYRVLRRPHVILAGTQVAHHAQPGQPGLLIRLAQCRVRRQFAWLDRSSRHLDTRFVQRLIVAVPKHDDPLVSDDVHHDLLRDLHRARIGDGTGSHRRSEDPDDRPDRT
jgi:hypothetical protein